MIEIEEIIECFRDNIKEVSILTGIDLYSVEQVITAQISLAMVNLAVEGVSENYLGKYKYDPLSSKIEFTPNELVKNLAEGTVDYKFILKEIIENA